MVSLTVFAGAALVAGVLGISERPGWSPTTRRFLPPFSDQVEKVADKASHASMWHGPHTSGPVATDPIAPGATVTPSKDPAIVASWMSSEHSVLQSIVNSVYSDFYANSASFFAVGSSLSRPPAVTSDFWSSEPSVAASIVESGLSHYSADSASFYASGSSQLPAKTSEDT